MIRELHSHKVNHANDILHITVLDEPGAGGANHKYSIGGFHTQTNASAGHKDNDETLLTLLFQNGPIPEKGVNGITQEALLAVLIDRLQSFQSGPYACRENAIALTKLQEAQMWLLEPTRSNPTTTLPL